MDNKSNLLNEKELEQVSGGLSEDDPVEPGNWYIQSGMSTMAFDPNTTERDYFYCKSAVGNGNFLFAIYTHMRHYLDGRCLSDKWIYKLDLVTKGIGMSKTYVSPDVLKNC